MKKNILTLAIACSLALALVNFTSCKNNETTKETTITAPPVQETAPPATYETAADVARKINVPTFEDPAVTQYAQDFKNLMIEYAALKGTGDQAKEAELERKFEDWANRASELSGKIKPEEMQKFNDFIGQAQMHFAEMKTAPAQ